MRLPRFRFTILRMMIAVAIVGVACCTVVLSGRCSSYLERAQQYGRLELLMTEGGLEIPANEDEAGRFGRLRVKYERSARFPWMSVPPDPPEEIRRQERLRGVMVWYRARQRGTVGQVAPDAVEPK